MTGGAVLFTRVFKGVNVSLARSYVFAFAVIAPLLVLLIGDLRRGLLALIPNLIPIYLVLGLMGWADIPIDVSTLLIGGIVLGLAVDDTIHFMHKFNRYYEDTGDARWAVHETLATTGSALLFTSLILSSDSRCSCSPTSPTRGGSACSRASRPSWPSWPTSSWGRR